MIAGNAYTYMNCEALKRELRRANAPLHIVVNADNGIYDPRTSPLIFPRIALLCQLRDANLHDLLLRVIAGEFD